MCVIGALIIGFVLLIVIVLIPIALILIMVWVQLVSSIVDSVLVGRTRWIVLIRVVVSVRF